MLPVGSSHGVARLLVVQGLTRSNSLASASSSHRDRASQQVRIALRAKIRERIKGSFLDNAIFVVVLAKRLPNASTSLCSQAPDLTLPKTSIGRPYLSQGTRETSERATFRTLHGGNASAVWFTVFAIRQVVGMCV